MTEAEAKTKVCFQASTFNGDRFIYADNDGGAMSNRPPLCIASACMAWRETGRQEMPLTNADRTVWVSSGYCGLAGAV